MENFYSRGVQMGGGSIVDWLPNEDGAALIQRVHMADDRLGTRIGSSKEGIAVDWVDTQTLKSKSVEPRHDGVFEYISDGRGTVRVMGISTRQGAGRRRGFSTTRTGRADRGNGRSSANITKGTTRDSFRSQSTTI